MPSNCNVFPCVCWNDSTNTLPQQISWNNILIRPSNIPDVAACNQTNMAFLSLIYEHGIKSTHFPQAHGTRSVCFYELRGFGLNDCLLLMQSWGCLIFTMQLTVSCYKPQILIALHCLVSWSRSWPALWPAKLTNMIAGPVARVKKPEFVVNVGKRLWEMHAVVSEK